VYRATEANFTFSHQQNIGAFGGKLYLMWSNGITHEDHNGQRILYAYLDMKDQTHFGLSAVAGGLLFLAATCWAPNAVLADGDLLKGELPYAEVKDERPEYLHLLSGKLFRERDNHAETSADGGKNWQRGGQINPFRFRWKLKDTAIQLQSAKYKGRIVIPYYFGMYPDHPDYSTTQRGGYAIWKGEKTRDDGQSWENFKTLELSPGVEERTWVEPPPLQAMVRGPSGPDNLLGEIPDGFTHYHYSSIFFSADKIFIKYLVSPKGGEASWRWRVFSISWLYEPARGSS